VERKNFCQITSTRIPSFGFYRPQAPKATVISRETSWLNKTKLVAAVVVVIFLAVAVVAVAAAVAELLGSQTCYRQL